MSAFTFLYMVLTSSELPFLKEISLCEGKAYVSFLCDFGKMIPRAYGDNILSPGIFGLFGLLLVFLFLTKPFRQRSRVLETIYLSISRPEDEPYTLRWIMTELITVAIIITIFFVFVYRANSAKWLYMVPVFAAAFGDGFSEIIGHKFGKHKYKVFSFSKGRTYYRSVEGSAAMFLCVSLICFLSYLQLPPAFALTYCLLPFAITLAEAKAPHSWDNPFIYLASYAVILATI